jgi:diguanylate cyclase (GGDEF)-like protein
MAVSQVVLLRGCATAVALVVGWLARATTAGDLDALTGVANRRGFDRVLQGAMATARRSDVPLSMITPDFDRFKNVNDRDGHAAGDRLLRNSTRQWSQLLRQRQTLVRIGGDEFVVLLPGCPAERASIPGRAAAYGTH